MKKTTIGLLMALLLVPAGVGAQVMAQAEPTPAADAPAAWDQQDPADSLYRAARAAMNRGDHGRAAELFHEISADHPRSTYAPNALYWEAFNRYRMDVMEELHTAIGLLELQAQRYPDASTRENGDARALATRIRGILARRGDESSARAIVAAANEMANMGAVISEEVARGMAMAYEEVAAQSQVIAEEVAAAVEAGVAVSGAMGRTRTSDLPQECREEAETQLAALNALMHMNTERALPVLEQVMQRRDPCSVVLRRRAVFLIADKESERSVDILLDAANNDPDVEVRRQAVFWLSEVDDPRAVQALTQFVRESDDDQVRERAIFALAQHDSPEAMQVVRGVAQDPNASERLRERAIFWLAEEGTREDVESLKGMFDQVESDRLAERILFAVGQTERPEDGRWLLSVAADPNRSNRLRSRAIFWAAEAGVSVQALGQLYDQLDDRELKERVIFGLSESEEPGAIDRLIDIARNETDPQLRTRAIFWLGNSNDERAADVLLEILANPGGDTGGG